MLSIAPSNAALVRQVLRGRRERFDALVRRHLNAVYAVAYSFTTNHADAEDVAQDAFLKAYTSLDTLREPAKFEGWVIAITRNSALRAVKKRQRDMALEKEAQVPAAVRPVDPARDELYRLLGEKIDVLDEPHREVLMLHYFAGKRTREIARLLDLSQASVLKRLQRAREALGGKMIEEIVGSRGETDWINVRSKDIGKLVLAASAGWTATQSGGGVAFGSALLSGRALALGVAGASGAAAVVAIAMLGEPEPEPEPIEAIVVAAETLQAEPQEAQEPAETTPEVEEPTEVEPEPELVPSESDDEVAEQEATPQVAVQPSEPIETSKIDLAVLLQTPVGVVFEDIYLWDILEFAAKTYKLPILIDAGAVYIPDALQGTEKAEGLIGEDEKNDEREYYTDGMFESTDMKDMTVFEILDELCSALALSYISEPGFIWISTASLIASEVKYEPDARFDAYKNEEQALNKAGLAMNDMHLSTILDFINDTYEVNIVLDYRVVRPAEKPKLSRPHEIPPGYVSDGWVPYISMKNVELRDLLKALLRPLNLSYEVRDNAVVVSSAARLEQSDSLNESLMTPDAMGNRMKAYRAGLSSVRSSPDRTFPPPGTLRLLRVQEYAFGEPRARILSAYRNKWYEEGDAFEHYQLIEIDLISGCCVIFDEELGRRYELCLPEDE